MVPETLQSTDQIPDIMRPTALFPRGLKVVRGSSRERFLMIVLLIVDCGIWLGMYLGITELTGEFNRYEWVDLYLPLLISVFTLSLIGASDPR